VISPDTIALVRDRTDIVAVVSESMPSLKRRGRSWVGLCPFHKEKTPSFHVNADKGFFHCFGCKESGSAIDFLMKQDGLTFPEAVRSLAERAGIVIQEERGERGDVDRQKKQRDDLYAVSQLAATFFERELREHAHRQYAIDELARRGLTPTDDAIQAFRIGYAPPGWDSLATFLKAQGVSPLSAEAVGLLVPRSSGNGHYDRFRHRLMFAVIDPQGRVVAFSGRVLPDLPGEAKPEQAPPKYINSPESPIYTKGSMLFGIYQARHAIRQSESATVVEGNFDVVSLHARGAENVVAPLGTAFTPDQAKLLRRYAPSVVLLFDGDAAGKKAVRLSREPCLAAGLNVKVGALPGGTDPDEFVRVQGTAKLAEVVARARPMLEHLIDGLLDQAIAESDAHAKAALADEVAKLVAEENDALVHAQALNYADRAASRLGVTDVRSLNALRDKFRSAAALAGPLSGPSRSQARIKAKPAGTAERAEIVGAIIEYPALLDEALVQEQLALLEGPSARTVAAVSDCCRVALVGDPPTPQKTLDTSNFLAQIPPAIQAFASRRLAAPEHLSTEEARAHLLENAQKLRRVMLERETSDIARETYKAAGDWDREMELARDAQERARQKHGL
jgi:DNA primase